MEDKKLAIHKLRVNIKSLAAESRFIRREIRRALGSLAKNTLHEHRVGNLRRETRHAHLLLAAVKQMSYFTVENKAHTEPNWVYLKEKARRIFGKQNPLLEEVDNWIDESSALFYIREKYVL